jgi:alkanesulfonate monooxygenase SsuD/methylene tetrahydromethanopterin reductase-like flavin-dependent oxidoreductase (luciferase family)
MRRRRWPQALTVRYGICVPNLGEFADPRQVAGLARRAEEAGWDGFFVWDHVVFPYGGPNEVADPWILLTLVAMATERIRFGPLVTPVARRRPGTLARQVTTLDRLSGGRLVFGAGLGFTLPAEFGTWGRAGAAAGGRAAAGREPGGAGRAVVGGAGRLPRRAGDRHGCHVPARSGPAAPPVWIGCNWPNRRPLRRAARWDGVVPQIVSPDDGSWQPTAAVVAEITAAVGEQRAAAAPFDAARFYAALRRIEDGPPR